MCAFGKVEICIIYTHVHVYTCLYIYTYAYLHTYVYVSIYTYVYKCIYIHTYIYVFVYISMYIYIYAYMFVNMYIYNVYTYNIYIYILFFDLSIYFSAYEIHVKKYTCLFRIACPLCPCSSQVHQGGGCGCGHRRHGQRPSVGHALNGLQIVGIPRLVGGLEHCIFSHILGIIIPFD